ncbi:MAG: hypothetical protein ACTHZW_00465 [Microbacteriaceae bacterium]
MSTDEPEELFSEEEGVLYAEEVAPQHGILGLTLRELLIVAAWLVMFVTSFFPVGWAPTLWAQGVSWLLPLGLPTAAVFLIVLRRFSPDGIRRFGSLGIDQFASVAFSVAALWWIQINWAAVLNGTAGTVWVPWVQLAALLALVVFSVFAPLIPGLREDFRGRLVTLAHRNANPARPIAERPKAPRPAAPAAPVAEGGPQDSAELLDEDGVDESTHEAVARLGLGESIPLTDHASNSDPGTVTELGDDYVPGYVRSSGEAAETQQPFWALAPSERDVFDEQGEPMFRIGPHAWALVLEDRGGAYVVRHDDGRVGYLHDIADLTRG